MDVYIQFIIWMITNIGGLILFGITFILCGLLIRYSKGRPSYNGEHDDRDNDTNDEGDRSNYDTHNNMDVRAMDREEPSYRIVLETIGVDSWFEVGASLGLPEWRLKAVEQSYPMDSSRSMIEIFELWRKADGEDGVVAFTWSSLLQQLEHTSLKRRLKKIKQELNDKLNHN